MRIESYDDSVISVARRLPKTWWRTSKAVRADALYLLGGV